MMAQSKMAKFNMAEFKMAAIIKLSQNEGVKFFCANGGNQSWQVWVSLRGNTMMAESKMAKFKFLSNSPTLAKIGSYHLHKKTSLLHSDWQCLNPTWQNSRWLLSLS